MHEQAAATAAGLLLLVAACRGDNGALPQGSDSVELDPAGFVSGIDNPYWPMAPAAVSGGGGRAELVSFERAPSR